MKLPSARNATRTGKNVAASSPPTENSSVPVRVSGSSALMSGTDQSSECVEALRFQEPECCEMVGYEPVLRIIS